jgi:hypothetical protein
MLLTSVADIREALGFDDMTDINAAINTALHAAEPILAATLNTEFARAEVTDTFYVSGPGTTDGAHVKTEFWLSRCFLSGTPSVTGHDSLGADINYQNEKGVARDWATRYGQTTLAITYQAGFETDENNPLSYDLTQVPSWLQEAAKMQAMLFLAQSAPVTEAAIQIDTKMLQQLLQTLLYSKIRYAPMALYPL